MVKLMHNPRHSPHRRQWRWLLAAACVALLVSSPGCVRRRLLVRSNPPGATVYVDNQLIGQTPCPTDFIYYGTREIRLVKPGYETLTVKQPIPPPWYELPPLDFVSENLVPREIQDYRTLSYNLSPAVIMPTEDLLARGDQLRLAAQTGALSATSLGAPSPGPANLGPPTIGAPMTAPLFVPPGATVPPGVEPLQPGIVVPPSGSGVLPPGGMSLEPLPNLPPQ